MNNDDIFDAHAAGAAGDKLVDGLGHQVARLVGVGQRHVDQRRDKIHARLDRQRHVGSKHIRARRVILGILATSVKKKEEEVRRRKKKNERRKKEERKQKERRKKRISRRTNKIGLKTLVRRGAALQERSRERPNPGGDP